jgi:hypothetical protein
LEFTHQKVAPTALVYLIEQDACFVVRDSGGQQLAYVYFEDEPVAWRQTAWARRRVENVRRLEASRMRLR